MNTCNGPDRSRVQVVALELVTDTPRIGWVPVANEAEPVVACSFIAESAQSRRPWASVLGAGGGVVLGVLLVVAGVVLAVVVAGLGVVFAVVAVVFAVPDTDVTAVLVVPVDFVGGVAVVATALLVVAAVVVDGVAFVELIAAVDATGGELIVLLLGTGGSAAEFDARTPVSGAPDAPLDTVTPDGGGDEDFLARPATRKITPTSTATAATITATRRSQ